MKIILFTLIVTLLSGCITRKKLEEILSQQKPIATIDTVMVEKIVTERDTVIESYTDVESIYAMMECDSMNQVLIKQIGTIKQGNFANISYKKSNDTIYLDCNCNKYKMKIKMLEFAIKTFRNKQTTVTVIEYKTSTIDLIGRWYMIITLAILALLGLLMWLKR
jgi:hypothetical protein